ncbi:hypothetical protein H5410_050209 [Solanum commersonii]|uniref:Uncharacterized protein n=1 Tax=Solanum commersonii TaxID=4109 RepID=A0A9J5WXA8_SOLCO|nr:hypothetical protein H5410_050209 [Solanum commersonii]
MEGQSHQATRDCSEILRKYRQNRYEVVDYINKRNIQNCNNYGSIKPLKYSMKVWEKNDRDRVEEGCDHLRESNLNLC